MSEAHLQTTAAAALQTPYSQGGLTFSRRFSTEGVSPYDEVQWERRTALDLRQQRQHDLRAEGRRGAGRLVDDGDQHRGLEISAWTIGSPERETGVRQLVSRVAETVRDWGIAGGYFASDK